MGDSQLPTQNGGVNGAQRKAQIVAVMAILLGGIYLVWRAVATINDASPVLSWYFYFLEAWGFFGLLLLVHSTWNVSSVAEPPTVTSANQKLALLIPTYNEPPEVLLPTVAAAVAVDLPHETWVLDDGNRAWVAFLAHDLGAQYVSRTDGKHAKAGNLNNALQLVDAELVGIVDADHVPSKNFFSSTVGYFDRDDALALVQTPQDFYNTDSFEHMEEFEEEAFFYRVIQPGKNLWNAAFWCGTGAIVRTEALRAVGGVATDSVSEDLLTTLRLHSKGWKTLFHNHVIARGLAPSQYQEYRLQRDRWGSGSMEVLRSENPFIKRGLTLSQRVSYLFSLSGWFDSWRLLGFILLPLIVLLSGQLPIQADPVTYIALFAPTYFVQMYAQRLLGRDKFKVIPVLIFDLIRMPISIVATLRLLWPDAGGFKVTPKGRSGDQRNRSGWPPCQSGLTVLSIAALVWFGASLAGLTPVTYTSLLAVWISALVVVFNISLLMVAIRRIRKIDFASERRAAWRFKNSFAASLNGFPCDVESISLAGCKLRISKQAFTEAGANKELWVDSQTKLILEPARFDFASDDEMIVSFGYGPGQWHARGQLARALFQQQADASRPNYNLSNQQDHVSVATIDIDRWESANAPATASGVAVFGNNELRSKPAEPV